MGKDTRQQIIACAKRLVREWGINHFTLADVAEAAGVSKGGLLYHFASKEALVRSMLEDTFTTFSQRMAEHTATDSEPGRWARAYVQATFTPNPNAGPDAAAALVAGIATDRALLEAYAGEARTWAAQLADDDVDPATVAVIQMAADGLWLNEALGLSPLSNDERKRFVERLIDMSRTAKPG
jgi:AcrR family transcriptional regulator